MSIQGVRGLREINCVCLKKTCWDKDTFENTSRRCQKLEFLRCQKSVADLAKSGPDFGWFWRLLSRHFSVSEEWESAPDFAQQHKNKTYFYVLDLFQFFRDAFTINIDLVSDENVSREPANKGWEVNIKTRVCREFSWQQTLGLGLIHLGETLLG